MAAVSKNARTGVKSQKFYCPCGGEVKMVSVFASGKLKQVARCAECKTEKRRPKEFK